MKKFKIFVYSGEPRLGALPCSEHRVIAKSGSHASKVTMDHLGRFPWKVIDALDEGDVPNETMARIF